MFKPSLIFQISSGCILLAGIIIDIIMLKCTSYYNVDALLLRDILSNSSQLVLTVTILIISSLTFVTSTKIKQICGIPINEFNKIKKSCGNNISFRFSCLVTLFSILIFTIFYSSNCFASAFAILFVLIIQNILVCILDTPILSDSENYVISLLNKYTTYIYKKYTINKGASIDESLAKLYCYVINKEGLQVYFEIMNKNEYDEEFKKKLLESIIDKINLKSFQLQNTTNQQEISDFYNKVLNDLNLNLSKIAQTLNYDKSKSYLITRSIFAIRNNTNFNSENSLLVQIVENIINYINLFPYKKSSSQTELDFYFTTIQNLIIHSVSKGDFLFLRILLKEFNQSKNSLYENYPISYLFANICIYLNYLLNIEKIYPVEYKKVLRDLLQQETHIDGNDEILKFDELQKYLNSPYGGRGLNIKLDKIMHCFNLCNWEYFINNKIKSVVISDEYVVDWYLIQNIKINENCFDKVVDEIAKIEEKSVKRALRSVLSKWFNADKITLNLSYFKKYEKTELNINDTVLINDSGLYQYIFDALFKLYNNLQLDYVEEVTKQSSAQDNKEIETRLLNDIKAKLESAYGYDPNIKITNDNKMLIYTPIEKDVRVINFFEAHAGSCWQSILLKIQQQTSDKCSILDTSHNINANIENLKKGRVNISNDFNFEYDGIKYISEENKNYIDTIEHQQSLNFPQNFYFNKDCYGFNYKIDEFSVNKLSDEELEQCISWYQKDDGQYYYHGAYMNRAQIAEQVKKVYITFKIIFRIEIKCDKEHCFILNINDYKQKQQ